MFREREKMPSLYQCVLPVCGDGGISPELGIFN